MIVTLLLLILLVLLFGAGAMRNALGGIMVLALLLALFALASDWLRQFSALQITVALGGLVLAVFVGLMIIIAMMARPAVLNASAVDDRPDDPHVTKLAEAKRAFERARDFLDDQTVDEAEKAFSEGNYNQIWTILRKARQGLNV